MKDALDEDEKGTFLKYEYAKIDKQNSNALIELSEHFNVNNPSSWTYSDQIIVYEFFKDLTFHNELYKYNFNDFTYDHSKVYLPIYEISHLSTDVDENGNIKTSSQTRYDGEYVNINGVYYSVEGGKLKSPTGISFLNPATEYKDTFYYNYTINLEGFGDAFGISTGKLTQNGSNYTEDIDTSLTAPYKFFRYDTVVSTDVKRAEGTTNFEPINDISGEDAEDMEKLAKFSMKLSDNFNFADTSTWTYRDYFIFYLYSNFNGIGGKNGIDSLKFSGINGYIGKIGSDYFYQVQYGSANPDGDDTVEDLYLYVDIDKFMNISGLLVNNELDHNKIQSNGDTNDVFVYIDQDNIITSNTESYKFEFSETFKESEPGNWTMLDFIMLSLSAEKFLQLKLLKKKDTQL